MNINDVIHGFKIINIRHSDEINADMYEMIHEKTNAKTIWLKRDDENKTFSIAFKTTPIDDTGVFHILEHSVLNGSKKYPVREPFVDLLKGSLQTFLNAMTYPDKTVYPVSSRNNKDFVNLMRVYLDAVFNPLVIENPNVFYQEGWHYELNDVEEEPIYKGVVFNEMKGAFSSADGVRSRYMMHALFPDNCYGNESGGDPEHITDLTYEEFCNAHHKYYNPSNSYIFLDGDMDIDYILGIIDDEYLSHYGKDGDLITIDKQKAVSDDETIEYEIGAEVDPKGKAQIAYGYVLGNFNDFETTTAMSLISSVLCSSNESELKKAILNNGLGEDVSFDVQDGILQPFCEIDVINTDLEKEKEITETINNVFRSVVEKGVDRKELEAAINQREFYVKERDYGRNPKGLIFALSALDTWLYGGDPLDGICADKLFTNLREKLNTSYYEDLINNYILNNNHHATIKLKPSNTLGEKKLKDEKEKLNKISSAWSLDEKKKIVELNKNLMIYQSSEDTPEQKATLPSLHIEDLKKTPTEYPIEVCMHGGTNKVLKHNIDTNGISYVTLFSEVNDFELKDYTVITQMLLLLSQLRTKNYDVLSLNREMKSILGSFDLSLVPMNSYKDDSQRNYVAVSFSSLHRNDNKAIDLVKEIIYNTDFSDKQAIRDILKQNIITLEQTFINAGNSLAAQRCSAYTSKVAVISEYSAGYEAYRYIKELDDNFDEKADSFIEQLQKMYKKIFIKERYMVSVASEDKPNIVKSLIDDAPSGVVGEIVEKKPLGHNREGIVVPSNVSYAVKSCALKSDIKNLGVMYVIANILTYDYLWTNIRVKGGAYGCGFRCGFMGNTTFHSYRDPNPKHSLEVYNDVTKYLNDFVDNVDSIENYIVGTTGDYDPLNSVKSGIKTSDLEYIMDIDYDTKKKVLDQILSASKDDIKNVLSLFDKLNESDNICIIGNKQAIEKCKDNLDNIFDLIKQ